MFFELHFSRLRKRSQQPEDLRSSLFAMHKNLLTQYFSDGILITEGDSIFMMMINSCKENTGRNIPFTWDSLYVHMHETRGAI